MGTLVLHQFEISPFCDKVRRALHHKRRHYEIREVPPTDSLVRLRRLNPAGKVPVLEHGERVICDSSDIVRYLEQTFPDPPLYPKDPRQRALCHFLEDWADESLYFYEAWFRFALRQNAEEWSRRSTASEPPLFRRATRRALPTLMRNMLRSQGIGRKPAPQVLEEFERHVDGIETWLGGGEWLVGEQLTVADIAVYAQLACAAETDDGAAVVSRSDSVLAWMERVNAATAPLS